ncbi:putative UDP-glycosyltransferase 71A15 [Hypsibius exemplaris]|uniref:UDP-glycosyltransferase 71A15 n=1 Tax=Hypsibius exemplaris TaxID=2072580 RepID=A0A1W0X5Y1_HYPEX|nr:putative UDP-glycosyltransferase 71A15 [Hypsibius exemplaris]
MAAVEPKHILLTSLPLYGHAASPSWRETDPSSSRQICRRGGQPQNSPQGNRSRRVRSLRTGSPKDTLSHSTTKVFVSHCGWNNTLEASPYGFLMVAWPMFGDQLMNAEWLEKEGVGKLLHGSRIVQGHPSLTTAFRLAFFACSDITHGHLIPLLELAKKIVPFHNVTFAVSECFVGEIQQKQLVPDGLFPIIGIADGVQYNKRSPDAVVSKVVPGAELFFKNFVIGNKNSSIDAVIAGDMLSPALHILHQHKIPFFSFNTGSSGRMLHYLSITPETAVCSAGEAQVFHRIPSPGAQVPPLTDTMKKMFMPMHEVVPLSHGVIANTVSELEETFVSAIQTHSDMKGISLFNVGPLFPDHEALSADRSEEQIKVLQWLNEKEPRSVVYVSFGTLGGQNNKYIKTIAGALAAIGRPFIYSLAKDFQHLIPEDCIGDNLVLAWAPQKAILQHPSTAVFLSHCGWNSTIESLVCGVPVVAWPLRNDQEMNALLLVEKATGVLIEGAGESSNTVITVETVEQAIREVGHFEDGVVSSSRENTFRTAAEIWRVKMEGAVAGQNANSQGDFAKLITKLSQLP